MDDSKNVGLLGLAFGSTNKGCEALGYGFLDVLEKAASNLGKKINVYIFEDCDVQIIMNHGNYFHLKLKAIPIWGRKRLVKVKTNNASFKRCDIIFDFTAGDSFSDIYGLKRFFIRSFVKEQAISQCKYFVLGSQTYGPYSSYLAKKMAANILNHSFRIYARDNRSCKVVEDISKNKAIQTVDVAFAMQAKCQNITSNKIKVGFNPSGLLWKGGYSGKNQFNLTINYQEYCRKLISDLLNTGKYEIYLVAHVLSNNMNEPDNDMIPCEILSKEFPTIHKALFFESPVEIKSYISAMDVFIGARMHATIAAYTMGVPVIPVSYSAKFEGLFESLDYNHVISATKINTIEALDDTEKLINQRDKLREEIGSHQKATSNGINFLVSETEKLLNL